MVCGISMSEIDDDFVLIGCGFFIAVMFYLLHKDHIGSDLDNLLLNIVPFLFIFIPFIYSVSIRFGKKNNKK